MILINEKEVIDVIVKTRFVQAIYKGAVLVWEALSSCFSGGFWANEKPWKNTDGWKN